MSSSFSILPTVRIPGAFKRMELPFAPQRTGSCSSPTHKRPVPFERSVIVIPPSNRLAAGSDNPGIAMWAYSQRTDGEPFKKDKLLLSVIFNFAIETIAATIKKSSNAKPLRFMFVPLISPAIKGFGLADARQNAWELPQKPLFPLLSQYDSTGRISPCGLNQYFGITLLGISIGVFVYRNC